jgi:hypothetical protein
MGFGRCPREYCNVGRRERVAGNACDLALAVVFAVVKSVSFTLLFAGSDPFLPLVIGDEGYGDEDEDGQAEEEFHGWL